MIAIRDVEAYLSLETASTREVMSRLNATKHLFQIIVDEVGRLRGTLTDGDVRRALLRGEALDARVATAMQRDCVSDIVKNRNAPLQDLDGVKFCPLLDEMGVVREILVRCRSGVDERIGRALVMAGGFGRRLGEQTRSTPKPLINVAGQPMLEHVLTALETAGVRRVDISIHYLGNQVREFIGARACVADIDFIEEEQPLGTAGALGLLAKPVREPVLIVNADVITDVDFVALRDFHNRHKFDATLGASRHDVTIPFGVIEFSEDGLFRSINEKPTITNFVSAGIYYIEPQFIELVTPGLSIDMPDLIEMGKKVGLRTGVFPIHEYWTDLGRPEDLLGAQSAKSAVQPDLDL